MNTEALTQLKKQLEEHSQQHVLNFWDDLSPGDQESLVESLSAVNFDQLNDLFNASFSESSWAELAAAANVPPAKTLDDFANPESYAAAREKGIETLLSLIHI